MHHMTATCSDPFLAKWIGQLSGTKLVFIVYSQQHNKLVSYSNYVLSLQECFFFQALLISELET